MNLKKWAPRAVILVIVAAGVSHRVGFDAVRGRLNALLAAAWQASGEAVVRGDLETMKELVAQAQADLAQTQSMRMELVRKRQALQNRRDAATDTRACSAANLQPIADLLAHRGNRVVVGGRVYDQAQIEAEALQLLRCDLTAGDALTELDAALATIDDLIREVDREIRSVEAALRVRKDQLCMLEAGELTARIRRDLAEAGDDPAWETRVGRVAHAYRPDCAGDGLIHQVRGDGR